MASGDLPSDFPLKEANLLGPMLHLLLDKAEEVARNTELPPQYPNDQDKYDKDLWSLETNKPSKFKAGIEIEERQSSSSIASFSDSRDTSQRNVSTGGSSSMKSSSVMNSKRLSLLQNFNRDDDTQDERSPVAKSPIRAFEGSRKKSKKEVSKDQNKSGKVTKSGKLTKKKSDSSKGGSTADRLGKLKDYRAVMSKSGKVKKGTASNRSHKKGSSLKGLINSASSKRTRSKALSKSKTSQKKTTPGEKSPMSGLIKLDRTAKSSATEPSKNALEGKRFTRKQSTGNKNPKTPPQNAKLPREEPKKKQSSAVVNKPLKDIASPNAQSPSVRRSKCKLADYFLDVHPDNRVYSSVFKLRRKNQTVSPMCPTQKTQKVVKESPDERSLKVYKPIKNVISPLDRRGESAVEMIDMPTEQSIPRCPVHKPHSQCNQYGQLFELPLGCAKKSFRTKIQAWKNNNSMWLPVKASLRRLKKRDGVDIKYTVYTYAVPGAKPFVLRAHCPHYKAKRVWINGELCSSP